MLSRANEATYTSVSLVGGVQTVLDVLFKLESWPKGDGNNKCGRAGTVAIGDRDSGREYS